MKVLRLFAVASMPLMAACAATSVVSPAARDALAAQRAPIRHASSPIQHVVFIVQENRSFNNLFMGYPGATTQNYGYDTNGDKIALQGLSLASEWDIGHNASDFYAACDGTGKLPGTDCKMDGWNNEVVGENPPPNAPYSYALHKDIEPYWQLAKHYSLADEMFASNSMRASSLISISLRHMQAAR